MNKLLHSWVPETVSYERNIFKFRKKFKNSTFLIATFTLLFFSFKASASHLKLISFSKIQINSIASDTSKAVFSNKTSLKLDAKSPLANYYVANISGLNFSNPLEMDIFFNNITDNLLSYKSDYKTKTVVINIHLAYANPLWTVADWNNYIHSKLNP